MAGTLALGGLHHLALFHTAQPPSGQRTTWACPSQSHRPPCESSPGHTCICAPAHWAVVSCVPLTVTALEVLAAQDQLAEHTSSNSSVSGSSASRRAPRWQPVVLRGASFHTVVERDATSQPHAASPSPGTVSLSLTGLLLTQCQHTRPLS